MVKRVDKARSESFHVVISAITILEAEPRGPARRRPDFVLSRLPDDTVRRTRPPQRRARHHHPRLTAQRERAHSTDEFGKVAHLVHELLWWLAEVRKQSDAVAHSRRRNGSPSLSPAPSSASSSTSVVASVSAASRDRAAKSPVSPLRSMHHCVHSGRSRSAALA